MCWPRCIHHFAAIGARLRFATTRLRAFRKSSEIGLTSEKLFAQFDHENTWDKAQQQTRADFHGETFCVAVIFKNRRQSSTRKIGKLFPLNSLNFAALASIIIIGLSRISASFLLMEITKRPWIFHRFVLDLRLTKIALIIFLISCFALNEFSQLKFPQTRFVLCGSIAIYRCSRCNLNLIHFSC